MMHIELVDLSAPVIAAVKSLGFVSWHMEDRQYPTCSGEHLQ